MAAKSTLGGVALALLAFGLYATHDVFVKFLGGQYAPFQIVFFSVLFGFPLVTVMLLRDQTADTLQPRHPWWSAARTAAALVTAVTAFYAFSVLPLAQTYAILFAAPLIVTVLSIPILGEKVGIHRWAAVAIGLAGVLVVLRPGGAAFELGHLAALTAAFSGAFGSIIVRKIGGEERSAVLILYPMVANFFAMGALMPVAYRPMPVEHLGMLALMALLGFLATLCIIEAYRRADAAIVAPMQYSQMLWATAFGILVFDEVPQGTTAAGAALVIASGVYIVVRESLAGTSRNRPVLRTRTRTETGIMPRASVFPFRRAAEGSPPDASSDGRQPPR